MSYAVAARELLRTTLLDAARELLADRTWAQVTMAEVARAAGVSRQTVYNEFGSRPEFAQALILREADELLESVEETIRDHAHDARGAFQAAIEVFLTAAAEDPLVRSIVGGGDEDSLLPFVTTRGGPVVAYGTERLAEVVCEMWPQVSTPEARELSDCMVRLCISHAALPVAAPRETARMLARVLGPHIEQLAR